MSKIFFAIISVSLLLACSNENSPADDTTLEQLFKEISQEAGIPLSYNTSIEDSVETINIQIESPINMMTEQTNILQMCYEAIYDERLYYDMYILLSEKGGIALGITSPDLAYISGKTPQAMKFMSDLSASNKKAMISSLAANSFTHSDIDTMIMKCSSGLSTNPPVYQGYELNQTRGYTFCNFIFKVDDEIYRLTYNLTEKDSGMSNIQYPSYTN